MIMAGVLILLALSLSIYIFANVHPSEVPLVTHYTAFGVAHLYRDQWVYLFAFAIFAFVVALVHIALMLKVHSLKGRQLALFTAWTGVGVLIFAWFIAGSIITIWSPV